MYSGSVVFMFIFLFWSTSAIPCGSWNFDKNGHHADIILTHPVEEEIFLVTFIEDNGAADATGENSVQSDSLPDADGLDDKLSGEVVDSAANKGLSDGFVKSDKLPSNATQEVSHQTFNTTEAIIEEVGFTTESVTEEE